MFSNLSDLALRRNNITHYATKFERARGKRSYIHDQFNIRSAKRAVKMVKDMVEALSSGKTIPLPFWIKTDAPSIDYMNEIRDYLKKI